MKMNFINYLFIFDALLYTHIAWEQLLDIPWLMSGIEHKLSSLLIHVITIANSMNSLFLKQHPAATPCCRVLFQEKTVYNGEVLLPFSLILT